MLPFTVRVQLAPADLRPIFLRITFRRPFVILFSFLGVAYLLIQGIGAFIPLDRVYTDLLPFPFVLFPPIIALMTIYRAHLSFKNSSSLREGVEYIFSEEEVRAKGVDTEWTYKWNAFRKNKEMSNYLLLYPSKAGFEVFPKKLFTEEQLNFIRAKTGKYRI
jgi:hypothetical protein